MYLTHVGRVSHRPAEAIAEVIEARLANPMVAVSRAVPFAKGVGSFVRELGPAEFAVVVVPFRPMREPPTKE